MAYERHVLIIYSNALMRLGLVSVLRSIRPFADYKIRAYAKCEDAAKELIELRTSSIVLLDSSAWTTLELDGGYAQIQSLIDRNIFIVLIASIDLGAMKNVQARGIRGLLSPNADGEAVCRLIEDLSVGREKFFPEEHATFESQIYRLSNRELEVLRLLCKGQVTRQVARNLGVRESTIRNHLSIICRKCGFKRSAQAIAAFSNYLTPSNSRH